MKTMMKKRLYLVAAVLIVALAAAAQEPQKKFSPEQFDAELQQHIVKEAALTQQEAAKFFPVYREMQKKQRALFDRQRRAGKVKPADEEGCLKAIQERDNVDVELKRIQQTYHNRFLDLLPASKVYDIIKAEDQFHRRKLKQWSHGPKPEGKKR